MEEERVKKSTSRPADGFMNQIPKRKCSAVSARHLAMSQVDRLAMFLTDKIALYVCINIFCVVIPFDNPF
jgi:hypothetical protein